MSTKQAKKLAKMRETLFEGYVDKEQFEQLEECQDEADPNFVEEAVRSYYEKSSPQVLEDITEVLEENPLNFDKLKSLMTGFHGSSTSIGAKKVIKKCEEIDRHCQANNAESFRRAFKQLKKEHTELKKKLDKYFQLANQVRSETREDGSGPSSAAF
ncbi:hypothetical protein OROMI_004367 [Orobanche minor]